MTPCKHCNKDHYPPTAWGYCDTCMMYLTRGTRPFEQEAIASAKLAEREG